MKADHNNLQGRGVARHDPQISTPVSATPELTDSRGPSCGKGDVENRESSPSLRDRENLGPGAPEHEVGVQAASGQTAPGPEVHPPSSRQWSGVNDDEPWWVEVEPDCMSEREPFTVSVWVAERNFVHNPKEPVQGAFLSSEQAREVAATLLAAADDVDRNNARLAEYRK